jgi:hypothetical protein
MAIFILCSSKKSISANQLSRMIKVSYKAAWFLNHRLRHAMSPNMPLSKLLTGTVEADETFVGGKGDRTTKSARKTPVVALIERGGEARVRVVSHVSARNLGECLNQYVSKDAVLNTDEWQAYKKVAKPFKAHRSVNHGRKQYEKRAADGSIVHVNTCESFFSLLKRGVYGAWHHVSREHLPKYANEFAFRWNHRDITDGERMEAAIELTVGKRLTYRQVI